MTTHKEALTLALEALEWFTAAEQGEEPPITKTITAIKEALAQPEQEPFGYFKAEPFGWTDCAETDNGAIALYDRPQRKEPEQEPVSFAVMQKPWVWLTLDERLELAQDVDWAAGAYCEYAEKIEAKLKEKNK